MRTLFTLLLSLLIPAGALAQKADPTFDAVKSVDLAFRKGAVVLTVPDGAHLKVAFMEVGKKAGPGTVKMGKLPPGDAKDELGEDVWHGTVRVPVSGEGLSGTVPLLVTYQPCTEGIGGVCFPPTTRTLEVKAADIPAVKGATTQTAGVPADKAPEPPANAAVAPLVSAAPIALPPVPAAPSSGLFWALLAAFGYGLAASLTPCVYPMIPITMAIVGAKGGGKARGFLLSLTLVLGMAVTYTSLGVVAGLSHTAFGAVVQKPAFLIPVALLFAVFALSLFGAFEIQLPQALQARLQGDGPRRGFGGAFVMGLVLGPLAAPCVGPFLGTVLVNIAQQQGVVSGALQLFVFALGMGMLFIAVGTFNAALPKSGEWLTRFKQVMGLLVLGYAAWSVRLLVPTWGNFALWTIVLLAGAAVFGVFEAAEDLVGQFRKGLAILMLVLGVLLGLRATEACLHLDLLPGSSGAVVKPEPGWRSLWMEADYEGALAKAKAGGKLVLVDTFAEWCAQCHELDEKTWPDPAVQAWIRDHAVAVRLDTDKVRPDLAPKLKIQGYPTILLLDGDGREVRRMLGFQKPDAILAWLNTATPAR